MKLSRRIERGARGKDRRRIAPTLIPISSRVLAALVIFSLLLFAAFLYAAPTVVVVALGGVSLAVVLSYPVAALSRMMPRSLAILATFLSLAGLLVLAGIYLVPPLIEQLTALVASTPEIATGANRYLLDVLEPLEERNLLGGSSPEQFVSGLVNDLFDRLRALTENLLSGLVGFISSAFNIGVGLFGVLFVAVYLLADVRMVKAAYLRAAPVHYRLDARELWEAFGESFSRYLGGLLFIIVIQGAFAGLALYFLGVPYAILLGAWVSVTAIIPYLGAFLGGIPAVVVALAFDSQTFDSRTTTALLVVAAYVLIQQLESNVLTPRVQGQALRVHPIIVLLAVIGGGELAGLAGVIFAVPALATMRVLLDFFRARVRMKKPARRP
ncbi:MAG: AI-2E family transporter [Actinomycetota bacterium]|jgi:predicted PurR-regulated permease PerM|nr:AI-2E family transporter [Actinomycetota bacterium]